MQKPTVFVGLDGTVGGKINMSLICLCIRKDACRFWNIYATVSRKKYLKYLHYISSLKTIINIIIPTRKNIKI